LVNAAIIQETGDGRQETGEREEGTREKGEKGRREVLGYTVANGDKH
jgi:hypothetical protein